jgi:hypothetical protein
VRFRARDGREVCGRLVKDGQKTVTVIATAPPATPPVVPALPLAML